MTSSADPARATREIRLVVPDARSPEVRRRIAEEVARLSPADEEEAMRWIESVSEFDNPPEDPLPSTRKDQPRE